ncbi:helveticin J family class III bacteriocin [Levilactobacillus cerevisiae]|uniref:helveticin J family class III bacteriocin n=1 Tax=Levilactobacillus cerevisiae TaxID=1704076 RepID=UPI000F7748CA|nr:helveticin J family class III bacteriocin [Levilactobacillus cerevisiae]
MSEENDELLDERFDSGRPVGSDKLLLDRGDFKSEQAMDEYFNAHPEAPRDAYDYDLKARSIGVGTSQVVRTSTRSTAPGTLEYTLSGLTYGNVVQSCYIGSSYLYTTQQVDTKAGAKQVIGRFQLGGSTLRCKDEMTLTRFGHGQTLQWFDNAQKVPYFWIVCKATKVDNPNLDSVDWGTQIGRFQYQPNVKVDYTNIARISSINRANKNGASFGTLKRCEAALDSARKYLLIWGMNTSGKVQFSYYKASRLNQILDGKENLNSKYISAGDAQIVGACIDSYPVDKFYSMIANSSVQGIEFNDNQNIYISGGASGVVPVIQKGGWRTHDFAAHAVKITGGILSSPSQFKLETEGIQLKGNYVYLNVTTHSDGKRMIFSIPKSAF